jgi:hypothetical protein
MNLGCLQHKGIYEGRKHKFELRDAIQLATIRRQHAGILGCDDLFLSETAINTVKTYLRHTKNTIKTCLEHCTFMSLTSLRHALTCFLSSGILF